MRMNLKNRSLRLLTLIAFPLCLYLAGGALAADTPKKGGTVTLVLNTDITHTDPHNSAQVDAKEKASCM
jgi:hypothetical protein